jgi:hypothetical protein
MLVSSTESMGMPSAIMLLLEFKRCFFGLYEATVG